MKKANIFLILTLLCMSPLRAVANNGETFRLSGSAWASVLTCGPGEEFYESFGHTAIRVCDSVNNIDITFNYGSFDFADRNFYLKFARGRLDYFVVCESFEAFMFEYRYFGRGVWEQRLLLDSAELANLFAALMENVKPENMYYKYDFFRDNCATRVRDIVDNALSERHLVHSESSSSTTYRDLIHKYAGDDQPWWCFGVDMLLGARCDRTMRTAEYMYIPLELMTQYDTTPLSDGRRLAAATGELAPQRYVGSPTRLTPTLFFWLLFAAVAALTLAEWRKGWRLTWLDGLLFGSAAAASLLLLFLWFLSDHWCTKWNLNLLWANPLFLLLVARLRRPCRGVSMAAEICLLLALVGWALLPQQFNAAVAPIILTLLIRLLHKQIINKSKS